MNYEQRYKEILEAVKELQEANPCDDGIQNWVNENFPELRESEDDRIRKGIIRNLEYLADRAEGFVKDELKERIAWLEKQGETFTKKDVDNAYIEGMAFAKDELEKQGQKPAWSEEDEGFLNLLLAIFKVEHPNGIFSTGNITVFNGDSVTSNRIIDWIKSIKDKVQSKSIGWSEEDESMYTRTLGILGKCYMGELPAKVEDELKWFKSRLKCFRPQRLWKPSEEQMKALHDMNLTGNISYAGQG